METEIRALTTEVRNLVATLERAERQKGFDKILARGEKKDMATEEWEESKPLIQRNFESWRDYLYKYALVLISILGFLATLIATKWIGDLDVGLVAFGICCIGLSVLIIFVSIFITLYLERKFVAANMDFTRCIQVGFHRQKSQETDLKSNPMRSIEKHLNQVINEREKELEGLRQQLEQKGLSDLEREKLEWEITDLETGIKGDKRTRALMKYVGVQYTSYETARLVITISVIVLSLVGLSIVLYALLSSYTQTKSKNTTHVEMQIEPVQQVNQ